MSIEIRLDNNWNSHGKIIYLIINHNLILIHRIINHNMLNTTNVNMIIRIEEHNKLVPKMIMRVTKWGKMVIFIVEYLRLTNKLPIIPLGNNYYAINNNSTDSSLTSLRTETSMMHKKGHCQIFNQRRRHHLLHLLALNQVAFQLKLIILLKFIQNKYKIN